MPSRHTPATLSATGVDEDYWLNSQWAHESDDERLAERINNDLQNLWRAGTSSGLGPSHPAMRYVDRMLQEWEAFYGRFREAWLARAWDPFDLWTEYHDDLMGWAWRMTALVERLPTLVPDVEQRLDVIEDLEARGVPERAEEYREIAGGNGLSANTKRLLWGFAAVGGLLVAGIWIATKRR